MIIKYCFWSLFIGTVTSITFYAMPTKILKDDGHPVSLLARVKDLCSKKSIFDVALDICSMCCVYSRAVF